VRGGRETRWEKKEGREGEGRVRRGDREVREREREGHALMQEEHSSK